MVGGRIHENHWSMTTTVLQRPRTGRVFAGVCAGLADRFGWNANLVRLLFVLSCLLPGPQFIVYIVMWIVIPNGPLTTQVYAPSTRA
jgi:phage shock protein PspC (stress-responsive transcriptional regulator)